MRVETFRHGVSWAEAFRVWSRIAALSFGGPAGQIAVMHRILVDEKRWISEGRFLHALNFCMLLPGPEAQQLATYIGWLMHGPRGGLLAGGLFILPGIVSIMALSWIYALFGQVGAISALFFGLKAAVLAVVLQAVVRVAARALRSTPLRVLAGSAFIAIYLFGVPFPLIILLAGAIGFFGASLPAFASGGGHPPSGTGQRGAALIDDLLPNHAGPGAWSTSRLAVIWLGLWVLPVAGLYLFLGEAHVFTQIALFFSKMAVVTFGGAYAVLAYVAQQAVEGFHWLRPGEMLDGLGMAETTPGPLVMVLQFVGFMGAFRAPTGLPPLLAATIGGLIATWVTFAPCFLWIFLGAPFIERLRSNKALTGALTAITAAVVGVILNLAVWFSVHTLFSRTVPVRSLGLAFDRPDFASLDVAAMALAIFAVVAIFVFRAGILLTLAGCATAGLLLYKIGWLALA